MKIPKKRGRPRLSDEEKARRKAEREAAKAAGRAHGPKKRVRNKALAEKKEESGTKVKAYILTPAGKCPIELYGHDKEAVAIWMSQVKNIKKSGLKHTVQSLSYWLRSYFDYFSDEYRIASGFVKDLAPTFDIVDYEPQLKRMAESVKAQQNLETVKKYIKTGDV